MSQALINFLAGLRNTAKDGLKTTVDNTEANPVPTSIVGSLANLPVELKGRHVEMLVEYVNQSQHIGILNRNQVYAKTTAPGASPITPLDVSMYRDKMIQVKNNYDLATLVYFYAYKTIEPTETSAVFTLLSAESLAAGASKVWYSSDLPKLTAPVTGFGVALYVAGTPTTGTVDIRVWGGVN